MADHLGVKQYDLEQYIHRERIFMVDTKTRNRAYDIVNKKFVHPEYFRPTRKFYKAIGMTQRQWWSAYRGEIPISDENYMMLAEHFQLTLSEAIELKQVSLNFSVDTTK